MENFLRKYIWSEMSDEEQNFMFIAQKGGKDGFV